MSQNKSHDGKKIGKYGETEVSKNQNYGNEKRGEDWYSGRVYDCGPRFDLQLGCHPGDAISCGLEQVTIPQLLR